MANLLELLNYSTMACEVAFILFFSQEDRGSFSLDGSTRQALGTVMVGLLICNFVVNFGVMVLGVVAKCTARCRRGASVRIVSAKTIGGRAPSP